MSSTKNKQEKPLFLTTDVSQLQIPPDHQLALKFLLNDLLLGKYMGVFEVDNLLKEAELEREEFYPIAVKLREVGLVTFTDQGLGSLKLSILGFEWLMIHHTSHTLGAVNWINYCYRILGAIRGQDGHYNRPPTTALEIASTLGSESSNVTRALEYLEAMGFVRFDSRGNVIKAESAKCFFIEQGNEVVIRFQDLINFKRMKPTVRGKKLEDRAIIDLTNHN